MQGSKIRRDVARMREAQDISRKGGLRERERERDRTAKEKQRVSCIYRYTRMS
jgi:hypothetical protein